MLSSFALPQKLVPPIKLEMFKTTMPCNEGKGMASPSHSTMTRFSRFLYVLQRKNGVELCIQKKAFEKIYF